MSGRWDVFFCNFKWLRSKMRCLQGRYGKISSGCFFSSQIPDRHLQHRAPDQPPPPCVQQHGALHQCPPQQRALHLRPPQQGAPRQSPLAPRPVPHLSHRRGRQNGRHGEIKGESCRLLQLFWQGSCSNSSNCQIACCLHGLGLYVDPLENCVNEAKQTYHDKHTLVVKNDFEQTPASWGFKHFRSFPYLIVQHDFGKMSFCTNS